MPVPYSSLANNAISPSIAPKRAATSVWVNTEGIRLGRVGRCTSVNQGKSMASTSRYKNSKALSAWLCVDTYPHHLERGGKWLIFVPVENLDGTWEKIRIATESGDLGASSKVATAKPNQNAVMQSQKVICVYTYDWTDRQDVMRIRDQLRQLGITWKIPYKSDEDTHAGKYANRGNGRTSKYYE